MKRFIGFFSNFVLASVFGYDIMDYYFMDGINIISNDINRVFVMWLGFITSLISSAWFMNENFKKRDEQNK
jgi:hypothetical protein